jgi:transcription elongation factor GreA
MAALPFSRPGVRCYNSQPDTGEGLSMTETIEIRPEFAEALEREDWDRVEEMWLEALEAKPIPTAELLEVRRLTWKAERKNLARTLLELLADALEESADPSEALAALRELVRLASPKPPTELTERMVAAFARARAESPSVDSVLEHHPMVSARRPNEVLEAAECWLDHDLGTVVEVVGQGVGRVVDLNLQLENIKVDLGGSRPVSIPFGAARRHLRPLPEGDFRRRKIEAQDDLAKFVKDSPGESLAEILESLGEPSDVGAIKGALDGLLPPAQWTSWWTKARKNPRVLSSGSGSRLRYTVSQSAESADETLLEELRAAEAGDRLAIARRLAERGRDTAAAAAEILEESLANLALDAPGIAWQTAGVLANLPGGADAAEACRRDLVDRVEGLTLLSGIPDRASRAEALAAIAEHYPDGWPAVWAEWLLHEEAGQLLSEITTKLESAGYTDRADQSLEAIFRNHNNHPAQFIWACETMSEDDCPSSIRTRTTPSLLEKLPDTLTRKEFASYRNRAKGLLDGGKVAIRLLMESANQQQASRFSQRISRIDSVEPQRQGLVEQAAQHQRQDVEANQRPVLAATRSAVEEKQEELRTLLEVEIPKTLKGINAAAAEGDLRENFEYHMLRDRQELQSARAAKLQEELAVVRILEPGAADTSSVNIGTVVHVEDDDGTALEPITILGAWDTDLDRRIFANGSELAQRMMGKTPGDTVEIDDRSATITRIEAWNG